MAQIPVLKAFNVDDMDEIKMYSSNEKIAGYVFDAAEPGSGRTLIGIYLVRLSVMANCLF